MAAELEKSDNAPTISLDTTNNSDTHTHKQSLTDEEKTSGEKAHVNSAVSEATPVGTNLDQANRDNSTHREETSSEEDKVEAHYVHGAARFALCFGLCVTTFLVGLDQMIIATAIPKITSLFHSLQDVGYVSQSFHLCWHNSPPFHTYTI
jgi:hypothetical protein